MAQRIKKVHDEKQVAHLWAHWTPESPQQEARKASNNMFFEGDTIYSYGRHFPIARHTNNNEWGQKRGALKECILFTHNGYSPTTSGHIASVRNAINYYPWLADSGARATKLTFQVDNVKADSPSAHKHNFENYAARRATALASMTKARARAAQFAREYETLTTEANEYRAFFGLFTESKLTITSKIQTRLDNAKANNEAHRKAASGLAKEKSEAAKNNARAALVKYNKDKALWLAGENVNFPRNPAPGDTSEMCLRLKPGHDATTIQTSRGAEVPYTGARRLYRVVALVKAAGKPWNRTFTHNGENDARLTCGSFEVNKIESNGDLTIGCHFIPFEVINAFAVEMGWTKDGVPVASADEMTCTEKEEALGLARNDETRARDYNAHE